MVVFNPEKMRYFLPHLIEQEGARQNHRKKQ